jgi:hypothetical protein
MKPSSKELPWAPPKCLPAFADKVSNTLFGQHYLSVTLDEAHLYRNMGPKHLSALSVLEKAVLRFVMTATPLQTSTKVHTLFVKLVSSSYILCRIYVAWGGLSVCHTSSLKKLLMRKKLIYEKYGRTEDVTKTKQPGTVKWWWLRNCRGGLKATFSVEQWTARTGRMSPWSTSHHTKSSWWC